MNKPDIRKNCLKPVAETRFLRMADLQYAEGKHYYIASRRPFEDYVATKSAEEIKSMSADAVTCFVIIKAAGEEPRLLFQYEFRYPAGQFLLSPPAGLIDRKDLEGHSNEEALLLAARREIHEETGLEVKDSDRIFVISPLLFSTPGMTDESNAIVCAVITPDGTEAMSNDFAEGSECFNGFELLTKSDAQRILKAGRDEHGMYFSVYTWAALLFFVAGMWE